MQALFYIALFGTFFFVASSITVGIAMSTMQEKGNQIAAMHKMFRDIDFAINEIAHREAPSLPLYLRYNGFAEDTTSVDFTLSNVSWSGDQLATDPWRSPIEVTRIREMEEMGAGVQAEVNYYILASPGPDRIMQTDTTGIQNDADWRIFRSQGVEGDDIIHTFSTRDAVNEIWNQASQVEQQIAQTAVRRYQREVETFNRENNDLLERITTCSLFPETPTEPGVQSRDDLGIDCNTLEQPLLDDCFVVGEYQKQIAENPDEEIPPPNLEILPNANVQVGECWRYSTDLQTDPGFPAMVGNMQLYGQTALAPDEVNDELGLWVLVGNDPFTVRGVLAGNIEYQPGSEPHELIIRRATLQDTIPGWIFTGRQKVITPEQ